MADVFDDTIEVEELLDEVDELLGEVVSKISRAENLLRGATGERLRQVRAQIESARNDDHSWLGGSMYTLQSVIDEL